LRTLENVFLRLSLDFWDVCFEGYPSLRAKIMRLSGMVYNQIQWVRLIPSSVGNILCQRLNTCMTLKSERTSKGTVFRGNAKTLKGWKVENLAGKDETSKCRQAATCTTPPPSTTVPFFSELYTVKLSYTYMCALLSVSATSCVCVCVVERDRKGRESALNSRSEGRKRRK